MGRDNESPGRRVDRRTVLAATAGLAGLAGCGGSSEEGEDTETTEANGTDAGGGETTAAPGQTPTDESATATPTDDAQSETGSAGPTECPNLPGSMTRFDPGSAPLPISFEYPSAMQDSIDFLNPNDWEQGNGVTGRIERGSDQDGDGDIHMTAGVDYFARYQDGKENWYENRSSLDEFASVTLAGESATFLEGETAGPYAGENAAHNAVGLIPYYSSEQERTLYFRTVLSIEVLLFRADADDVTESCGSNLRATLRAAVESLQSNEGSSFEEYIDY